MLIKVRYENIKRIYKDYHGDGLSVTCCDENVEIRLLIFSDINMEYDDVSKLEDELTCVLSWVKANQRDIHKNAVSDNYDWMFDELISDSDYYEENGSVSTETLVEATYLAWIKVFCENFEIKSILVCYQEKEIPGAADILGGHTFGIEIDSSQWLQHER